MRKQQRLALHRETLRQLASPVLGDAVRGGEILFEPSVSASASVKIACTAASSNPSQQEICGGLAITGPFHQV